MPEGKRIYRTLFVIAALIAIATVYGRYHYLADATCGAVIVCVVAFFLRAWPSTLHRRLRSLTIEQQAAAPIWVRTGISEPRP
jgi:membrane-associated phospholipid phosphatase